MVLPPKLGGLGILIFADMAEGEFKNSKKLTGHLTKNIVDQEKFLSQDHDIKKIKSEIKSAKQQAYSDTWKALKEEMGPSQLKLNQLACTKGASSWLTLLPLADEGYDLNKELFWDLISIRYGFQLKRLPTTCECGSPFDLQHAMSCKKGGFVSLRHNELRNAKM